MKPMFLIVGVLFAVSCAPKPDDVCNHLLKVYGDSASKPAHLNTQDQCVQALDSYRDRWGVNGYRRYAECVLQASTQYQAQECYKKEKSRAHS